MQQMPTRHIVDGKAGVMAAWTDDVLSVLTGRQRSAWVAVSCSDFTPSRDPHHTGLPAAHATCAATQDNTGGAGGGAA
jgi:hypothetical protein